MAIVPQNDNPYQVSPSTLSATAPRNVDMPKVEHGVDENNRLISAGMENVNKAYDAYQQEIDSTRVMDAANQLEEERHNLKYGDEGYTHFTGGEALTTHNGEDLTKFQARRFDKAYEQISGTLGNDAQKIAFRKFYLESRSKHMAAVADWKSRQAEAYRRDTRSTAISQAYDKVTSEDPSERLDGMQTLYALAHDMAREEGIDEAGVRKKIMGPAFATIAQKMVDSGQAGDAKRFIQENRGDMDVRSYEQISSTIDAQALDDRADEEARKIFGKTQDPEQQRKAAGNIEEPKLKAKVLSNLNTLNIQKNQEQAYQLKNLVNATVPYVQSGKDLPTELANQIKAISPTRLMEIQNAIEARQEREQAKIERAQARQARIYEMRVRQREEAARNNLFQLIARNPEKLDDMNPLLLAPIVGDKGAELVAKMQGDRGKAMRGTVKDALDYADSLMNAGGIKSTQSKSRIKEMVTDTIVRELDSRGKIDAATMHKIVENCINDKQANVSWFGNREAGKPLYDAYYEAKHGGGNSDYYIHLTRQQNQQAVEQMKRGATIDGVYRQWRNGTITPDQVYAFQMVMSGRRDYPKAWIEDARRTIADYNRTAPDGRKLPSSFAVVQRVLLGKYLYNDLDRVLPKNKK